MGNCNSDSKIEVGITNINKLSCFYCGLCRNGYKDMEIFVIQYIVIWTGLSEKSNDPDKIQEPNVYPCYKWRK